MLKFRLLNCWSGSSASQPSPAVRPSNNASPSSQGHDALAAVPTGRPQGSGFERESTQPQQGLLVRGPQHREGVSLRKLAEKLLGPESRREKAEVQETTKILEKLACPERYVEVAQTIFSECTRDKAKYRRELLAALSNYSLADLQYVLAMISWTRDPTSESPRSVSEATSNLDLFWRQKEFYPALKTLYQEFPTDWNVHSFSKILRGLDDVKRYQQCIDITLTEYKRRFPDKEPPSVVILDQFLKEHTDSSGTALVDMTTPLGDALSEYAKKTDQKAQKAFLRVVGQHQDKNLTEKLITPKEVLAVRELWPDESKS